MSFHEFHVTEVFSNADGTVQFIEMRAEATGQEFWNQAAAVMTVTQNGVSHAFTSHSDLPGGTVNGTFVLLATQGFANLGLVAPDFIIPDGFLFTGSLTTTIAWGLHTSSYVSIPVDGVHSLNSNAVGGAIPTNAVFSPKNFAGATGSIFAGDANANVLTGGAGNDFIGGLAGDDTLAGGAGNDILDGGTGSDSLVGGAGNDRYVVDSASDVITENLDEGTDTVTATISYSLDANVENLVSTVAVDTLTRGNELDNILTSGSATGKLFDGGAGNDTLIGNVGNDSFFGGTGDDSLAGGAGNDSLSGDQDNDTLDGGAGSDTMFGGAGNDSFIVDSSGDRVIENAGEGSDTVQASASFVLDVNSEVEILTLTGSGNISVTGSNFDNVITGNTGNNLLSGGAGSDTLTGNAGNDTLDGGSGNDSMAGGAGNDGYGVDSADDVVVENAGEGTDLVLSTFSYTLGANLENLSLAGSLDLNGTGNGADNFMSGNTGNNSLDGGAGNDTLDGGTGNDTLTGGAGNDTFVVDSDGDVVTENADEGVDTVQVQQTVALVSPYALGANLENLILTGTAGLYGIGNSLDNVITGNAGGNILDGAAGNDTLAGGAGDDYYYVDGQGDVVTENAGAGNDTVGSAISYTLGANVENLEFTVSGNFTGAGNDLANVLTGNTGDDSLSGAGGNDTLNGGLGNDSLDGGAGNDLVNLSGHLSDYAFERLVNGARVTVIATGETDVLVNVERLHSLDGEIVLATLLATIPSQLDDVLTGGSGNDTFGGLGGNDTLFGLGGDDSLSGGTGNDRLDGAAGNDSLDGGTGNDVMLGGAGNDIYFVDTAGDAPGETLAGAAGGTDTVHATVGFALGANLENLVLEAGSGALAGGGNELANLITGNALANVLSGNAGDDTLDGGAGNDTLRGGAGNDSYVVDDARDVVVENSGEGTDLVTSSAASYTLGANIERLTLSGSANISGTGNDLANVITGNAGDNLLDGGAGNDTLAGGAGNDSYVVDSLTDVVTDTGGTDTVIANVTYSIALSPTIENAQAAGIDPVNLTGNALDNMLTGNSGANVLDGGAGADTLAGGAGDDTYVVDNAGDVVTEFSGQGRDTIVTPFETVLSTPFENLFLSGTGNVNATGNAANNVLHGNVGNNVLDGGTGMDTMDGGAGNDTYVIDRLLEQGVISDSGGVDTVISGAQYTGLASGLENLTLTGNAWYGVGNDGANAIVGTSGANVLQGGAGNDTLSGGGGADVLIGGDGADRFVFDTPLAAGNVDVVIDFSATANDRIVLDNDVFGALATLGTLAPAGFFAAAGAHEAANASEHIVLDTTSGALYYDADGAGGDAAVQIALIIGTAGITAANFEVVE